MMYCGELEHCVGRGRGLVGDIMGTSVVIIVFFFLI